MTAPIVLLTDFGLKDNYAGILKGVIHSIHPKALVLDLCHEIQPQNILQGAIVIENSYSYYPKGSIFVCVVDPGVGTNRQMIAVKSKDYVFVGPDNGLLSLAVKREKKAVIRQITNQKYFLKKNISATFHGRDVFSPVGAHLSRSPKLFTGLGPVKKSITQIHLPKIKKIKSEIQGQILYFDHFGNGITNIRRSDAGESLWKNARAYVGGKDIGEIRTTYADAKGWLCGLFNSFDEFEICLPNGSAMKDSGLKTGDLVRIAGRS